MDEARLCPSCASPLADDAPQGLCPSCLMKQALVESRVEAGAGADTSAPDPASSGSVNSGIRHSVELPPGTIVGRYKLLERVGEGGFGVVYVAEQKTPIRRRVALKIIKLGMDTRAVVGRFEAERQALAMMDHPNIAKVLDAGATDIGRPYFVMELVRGIPITQYCDENRLTSADRLQLFTQVCNAIQHAHQKGIIHRDIKPTNILVTLHDGIPVPKVIDFGIAKATQGDLTDKTVYTQLQQFIGTPAYMSPEQAEMSGLDIDTRTDIYSLGVLLYELLTGTTPFDPKALLESGVESMRKRIREAEPPKPSNRLSGMTEADLTSTAKSHGVDRHRLIGLLRGDLDWIVMKCLEKDRARRYETANGLAMDIQRHLNNEPILARPPSAAYRFRKMVGRNKAAFGTAAAVAAALLVGIVFSTTEAVSAARARDTALRSEHEATRARAEAESARADEAVQRQRAELALAQAENAISQTMVQNGEILRLAAHYSEAHDQLASAYARLEQNGEWRLPVRLALWNVDWSCPRALMTYAGHTEWVDGCAFSPDGHLIASAGADKTVKLWDVATGRLLRTLTGHTDAVESVVFAPDGAELITGSRDNTVRAWNVSDGRLLTTFKGHTSPVYCVALSPDGRTIASGSTDRTIRLWNLEGGKEILTIVNDAAVYSVAFSPDGSHVASGSADDNAALWDIATGRQIQLFSGHTDQVRSVRFTPDGKSLLSGSADATLRLWDVNTGREIRSFIGHTLGVYGVAISPDGRTALSAGDDEVIREWDLSAGRQIRIVGSHAEYIDSVAYSPDGRVALTSSWDHTLKLWDLAEGREERTYTDHAGVVDGVAVTPDARIALSTGDRGLTVWDLATGHVLRRINASLLRAVRVSPDGRLVVTGSSDKLLRLWDLYSGRQIRQITADFPIDLVALSPDGQTLVAHGPSHVFTQWYINTGQVVHSFSGHTQTVYDTQFSRDGKTVASASADRTIKLWDLKTSEVIRTFVTPPDIELNAAFGDALHWLAFSPDNKKIAAASSDRTIKVWNIGTGTMEQRFTGNAARVFAIAYSADGRSLVSLGDDLSLRVWDGASGTQLRNVKAQTAQPQDLAVIGNCDQALTCGIEGTFKVWDFARAEQTLEFEKELNIACAVLQANPDDATACLALGRWWAFRGFDDRAVEFLEKARTGGAKVSDLLLARCDWNLNRIDDARREFAQARAHGDAPADYLNLCIEAADGPIAPATQP